jgi:hypothetical protein
MEGSMCSFRLFLALVTAAVLRAQGSEAPRPITQSVTFGMVGLLSSQVARLNAVNPAPMPVAGYTCSVQLWFLDSQGTVLKSQSFPLDAQKAILLDLYGSGITSGSNRVEIRGVVSATLTGAGPDTPPIASLGMGCNPLLTLELFDKDSGRTAFILSQPAMVPLVAPPQGGAIIPRQNPRHP